MSKVFVLDTNYKPLNPVHPGRARLLLKQGKASMYRRFPFTIILRVEVHQPQVEALRLKIDPGSKTTGIAVVNDASGEMDILGFPRTNPKRAKSVKGFQTGDMVRAVVSSGIKVGTYVGRVAVRATGSFDIMTKQGTIQGISHRSCISFHKCDGYNYGQGQNPTLSTHRSGRPVSSPCMNAGVSTGQV